MMIQRKKECIEIHKRGIHRGWFEGYYAVGKSRSEEEGRWVTESE